MDISRLMVYMEKVEEEKLGDRQKYRKKKAKSRSEFGQHKGGSSRPQFRYKRGMHHHLLVHMCPKTEVSIIARIRKSLRIDKPIPKVVWHKKVVGVLHVVGVVESTLVSVMMAIWVVSNAVKSGTTRKSFPRIK